MRDDGLKAVWYFDSRTPTCRLEANAGQNDELIVHYNYTYTYPTVHMVPNSLSSYAKLTGTIANNKMTVTNAEKGNEVGVFKLQ
jgi:hypothetical protein